MKGQKKKGHGSWQWRVSSRTTAGSRNMSVQKVAAQVLGQGSK